MSNQGTTCWALPPKVKVNPYNLWSNMFLKGILVKTPTNTQAATHRGTLRTIPHLRGKTIHVGSKVCSKGNLGHWVGRKEHVQIEAHASRCMSHLMLGAQRARMLRRRPPGLRLSTLPCDPNLRDPGGQMLGAASQG